jgi:hypothetical protein
LSLIKPQESSQDTIDKTPNDITEPVEIDKLSNDITEDIKEPLANYLPFSNYAREIITQSFLLSCST